MSVPSIPIHVFQNSYEIGHKVLKTNNIVSNDIVNRFCDFFIFCHLHSTRCKNATKATLCEILRQRNLQCFCGLICAKFWHNRQCKQWHKKVRKKWPCPVAQSVERLGRSDSHTKLAGAGSIPERDRSNYMPPFLPFSLSPFAAIELWAQGRGKELWAHSMEVKRWGRKGRKARGTQTFRGMQMENCCRDQSEKGSSP